MSEPDGLITAASNVDVIDCAGRIIGNPRRNAVGASAAEVLALACAAEIYWQIVLDAEQLARLIQKPFFSGDDAEDDRNDATIGQLARKITETMAAIRGTEEVQSDD